MVSSITKTAAAKVNLCLQIIGRRADGYHLLESMFVRTQKGDQITVTQSEELSLAVSGPFAASLRKTSILRDNIILGAANLLREEAGIDKGASISLEKNLPIAAGIGGGSADAAATLLALNELWAVNWSMPRLEKIAIQLGADVPACLYDHPLWVTGVGDVVTPVTLDVPRYIIIANPKVGLSTPVVFKKYQDSGFTFDPPLNKAPTSLSELQASKNSLEPSATKLSDEVTGMLSEMNAMLGAKLVRMSGSGATCFALFLSSEARDRAADEITMHHGDWWVQKDIINVIMEP